MSQKYGFLFFLLVSVSAFKTCQLPNNENGVCVPITSCPKLLSLHNNISAANAQTLRDHLCEIVEMVPQVCCLKGKLPSLSSCGLATQSTIFGGEKAMIDEFPWMVLLQYSKSNGTLSFECGGSLISDRYVLTAAHCIRSRLKSVRLGEYNTATELDCVKIGPIKECAPPPVDILIDKAIVHEKYNINDSNQFNDIALLRLKTKVNFSDYIQPICLPPSDKDFVNQSLFLAGWGFTENNTASNIKLKVRLPVKDFSFCESTYRRYNIPLNLIESQLCVGGEKEKDACKGDSGGPLMSVQRGEIDGQWYVGGIVSFGPMPCGMKDWAGVYTKVPSFVDWIKVKILS